MSTTFPRWIIVDDTDPSIQYTGPWFPIEISGPSNDTSLPDLGLPFQNTLHGIHLNVTASLSFVFNGTQIQVAAGSGLTVSERMLISGATIPLACFINGSNITVTASPKFSKQNGWILCEATSLPTGSHTLTVNITAMPTSQDTLWLDEIMYLPSATVPLDHADIIIDSLDPQLQYGQGWQALSSSGESGNVTTANQSTFSVKFVGISLSWYGLLSPDFRSLSSSQATYAIDGQTPIGFQLSGLPGNAAVGFTQKFFETPTLPAGPHTLDVVYQGNNQETPLTLTYLALQNGTTVPPTPPVGAIVGGVVGGVALIALIIIGVLFFRRRKEKKKVLVSLPKPFDYTPLHLSNNVPSPSSGEGSQSVQTGTPMTYATKAYTHGSMPSISALSSSPAYPAQLRPVSPQTSSSTATNPLIIPGPSTQPLPRKMAERAEALAALMPQQQGNAPPVADTVQSSDTGSNIVLHEDSGIRMNPSAPPTVIDVPPVYSAD